MLLPFGGCLVYNIMGTGKRLKGGGGKGLVSSSPFVCLQQIKSIERYMRRLEFHMSKVRAHRVILPVMTSHLMTFDPSCYRSLFPGETNTKL